MEEEAAAEFKQALVWDDDHVDDSVVQAMQGYSERRRARLARKAMKACSAQSHARPLLVLVVLSLSSLIAWATPRGAGGCTTS